MSEVAGIHFKLLLVPETKGRVGEIGRAVKVPDSKTASDIIHGRQRHVTPLHYPPLNETLTGAITKSYQAIVVIQTEKENNWFVPMKTHIIFFYCVYLTLIQPIIIRFSFFHPIFFADLLHTTPHLENLDWLLMREGLSGFLAPNRESVHTSHSLCPVAKFQ